jgi:hypothetical protein
MGTMRQSNPTVMALAIVAAALLLPAAASRAATPAEAAHVRPARIESIAGSTLRRITLTERAAQRLDIRTAEVAEGTAGGLAVPYAAIVYDLKGASWVYINPEPHTYVRHPVSVARVEADTAHLKEGPPAGTRVVTVGVAQLYGAEKGIGH